MSVCNGAHLVAIYYGYSPPLLSTMYADCIRCSPPMYSICQMVGAWCRYVCYRPDLCRSISSTIMDNYPRLIINCALNRSVSVGTYVFTHKNSPNPFGLGLSFELIIYRPSLLTRDDTTKDEETCTFFVNHFTHRYKNVQRLATS